MPGIPLPAFKRKNFPFCTEHTHKAYTHCLDLEQSEEDEVQLHARTLGYLLLYAPTQKAAEDVETSIFKSISNLDALGRFYLQNLIYTCTLQCFLVVGN
jgi:hypothetical protein